ncbi:hypothetical protein LINGRAHAP2_LOCUS31058, partial [Linum grandiflorum]
SLIGRGFWPVDPKPSRLVLQALHLQWRIYPQALQVFDVAHGLIQIFFPTMKDKIRIFESQHWAYKSAIINLVEWDTPSQEVYNKLQFMPLTVQLMELPFLFNTAKFGSKLVQPLRTLIEADLFSKYPDNHSLHFVKCIVRINLLQSLQCRIKAVVLGQPPFWV